MLTGHSLIEVKRWNHARIHILVYRLESDQFSFTPSMFDVMQLEVNPSEGFQKYVDWTCQKLWHLFVNYYGKKQNSFLAPKLERNKTKEMYY